MKHAYVLGFSGCLALSAWGCGSPNSSPEDVTPATGGGAADSAAIDSVNDPKSSELEPESPDAPAKLPGAEPPPGVPPKGCVHGFVGGALSLALDADVPSVKLEAKGGKLLANNVACTDASGNDVAPERLASLRVDGDAGDNAVIWDLGAPEKAQLWLGEGKNSLHVIGSDGADHFRHGMRDPDVVLDLAGNGQINLVAESLAALAIDLGGGDDRLDDLAPTPPAADAEPAPEADPTLVPITSLSVPLIATGGDGNDWIVGGSANDNLDGGPGDDVLSGLGGNDTFRVAAEADGADVINGGPGYDEISYELRQTSLTLQMCLSDAVLGCTAGQCSCTSPSGADGENDRLVNLEDITGGDAADLIEGSDGAESLSGGPGDDTLFGGGGSDVLYGQTGSDVFDGGPDGDYCDGRAGETSSGCEL
jgi:Ca2+-binding RTX toxin-like protein